MQKIKDKIFDLVYGEITDRIEVERIMEAVKNDPELTKYYETLEKQKEILREGTFVDAPYDLLAQNRERLSESISASKVRTSIFINNYIKNFAKYAAVVLLTFYATMYHFGPVKPVSTSNTSQVRTGGIPYTAVSHTNDNIYSGIDLNKYKVDNLNIDEIEGELIINFDVSTNKVIRGAKNDPEIINMLKYLVENENNSGVKYKTMKAMDFTENKDFTGTLTKVMTTDKDPIIRRKAMKMLEEQAKEENVRDALYQVVLSDTDQTNRIEALGILERSGSDFAGKALRSVTAESSDYFRFKADEMKENEQKGQ